MELVRLIQPSFKRHLLKPIALLPLLGIVLRQVRQWVKRYVLAPASGKFSLSQGVLAGSRRTNNVDIRWVPELNHPIVGPTAICKPRVGHRSRKRIRIKKEWCQPILGTLGPA